MGWETLGFGGCSEAKDHMAAEAFLPGQKSAWAPWNWHICLGPLRAPFWMGLASGDGVVAPVLLTQGKVKGQKPNGVSRHSATMNI